MCTTSRFPRLLIFVLLFVAGCTTAGQQEVRRPNILFAFADDWGYPDASIYGQDVIQTPTFDRIAQKGVLFKRSFADVPSCTPSRASVLTGQHTWRLKTGANLFGPLPADVPVYPNLLEEKAGYVVGYARKGWGPGDYKEGGRNRNPAGRKFPNFPTFLEERPSDQPFCFWFGSSNPHRGYYDGLRKKMDIPVSKVDVPPYLPDTHAVRKDIANYFAEVQQFDRHVSRLLDMLKKKGELTNTVVVISGDHGWPFPRGKTNLYDSGVRVPLAIWWPGRIEQGEPEEALVTLSDLAPTFLDLAEVAVPDEMTGHSLMPLLQEKESMKDRTHWQRVFTARERHVVAQEEPETGGYPMRAIRTKQYLYIRNFAPDRWPAGTPNWKQAQREGAWLSDCDNGPTKYDLWAHRNDPEVRPLYKLAFGKRPAEELYDISEDPYKMNNVAEDPEYQNVKKRLRRELMERLKETGDPRATEKKVPFDDYPVNFDGGPTWPGEDVIQQYK